MNGISPLAYISTVAFVTNRNHVKHTCIGQKHLCSRVHIPVWSHVQILLHVDLAHQFLVLDRHDLKIQPLQNTKLLSPLKKLFPLLGGPRLENVLLPRTVMLGVMLRMTNCSFTMVSQTNKRKGVLMADASG